MPKRNAPCLCGSGKKYKKCCALSDDVSQTTLIQEDTERILQRFLENPLESYKDMEELERYESEWVRKLRNLIDEDFLNELLPNYFLFVARQDLWKRYVVKVLNGSIRPGTKEVLSMWQNPFVLFGEIIDVSAESFTVSEILGHNTYTENRNGMTLTEGGLIIGIALPDTRDYANGITLMNAQTIIPEATEEIVEVVTAMAEESGEQTSHAFFVKHLVDVYQVLFEWRPDEELENPQDVPLTEDELSVLVNLDNVLTQYAFHEDDIEIAQKIALLYLQDEPNFRKAAVVAAAVVYVAQDYDIFAVNQTNYGQKEIAKMFGTSVSAMRRHIDAIEEVLYLMFNDIDEDEFVSYSIGTDPSPLEEESWQLFCKMASEDVTEAEAEAFIQKEMDEPFKPENDEQLAQSIAYKGYHIESTEEILSYSKRAAKLNPKNVDALLLKAMVIEDDEQINRLYQQAIQYGSETFNDQVDDLWAFIPNRPYLRALFSYGVWLYEKGDLQDAVEQFETLLVLDEADYLHASHFGAAIHIQLQNFGRARDIIEVYCVKKASGLVPYLFLQWYVEAEENGEDSELASALFEDASQVNPYVEVLIDQELPVIPFPLHESIVPGSAEEAMYIWILLGGGSLEEQE